MEIAHENPPFQTCRSLRNCEAVEEHPMIEYALLSGQSFLSIIEPALEPLRTVFGKIGLNLSVAETGLATLILAGFIIVSVYFPAVKR